MDVAAFASERAMRAIERTPLPRNIAALLDEAAGRRGAEPVAVFFDDGLTLTYRELRRRVTRFASGLARLGVERGAHVAVMLDTDVHYPVAWLALATLGAVTVPVNPAYTPRELAFVLGDVDASLLILHADHVPVLDALETPPLPRDRVVVAGASGAGTYRLWQDVEDRGADGFAPDHEPDAGDIANIQYTSGTTGLPKGARIPHAYWLLRGRVWNAQLHFPIRRNLIAQPFHYVDGQAMFMLAVTAGGTAYIARRQSATRFLRWVKDFRVDFCSMPEIVARTPEAADDAATDLRIIYCYSHRPENYAGYERRFRCPVRQGFGMTELGSALYVPVEADAKTGSGTVGIPSAHRQVKLVDERGQEVAPGAVGEIAVRGYGIFEGYHNRPEANAAAFLPGGWLRSGDAGRRDSDGFFYYLGRLKDMVRRSGENISAVEVESVLRGAPGILEAAVVPVPDDVRGEEVKAYIKLDQGLTPENVTPLAVLAHCARNLARFKQPRYIEYVADFPRTPGLKIRKSELIAAKSDLRAGCYDAVEGRWRSE